MNRNNPSSPTDTTTPCDLCGGGTYAFASGSVWCPAERNDIKGHAGGHFVVRVAFERPPTRDTTPRVMNPLPRREPRVAAPRRASEPTAPATKVKPANDGFDTGMDGFIEKPS